MNKRKETVIELRNEARSKEEAVRTSPSSEEYTSTIQGHKEELDVVQREMNESRQKNENFPIFHDQTPINKLCMIFLGFLF